jgi:NAD(P)-dependent dehydrogenase (short-subunit alcohol dehydrogenase family)
MALRRMLGQAMFIPPPPLTQQNLADQTGKVHIVTGGYAGVGHELVQILYAKNATVYSAGRSESKATKSIEAIKAAYPNSKGKLYFLFVDLSDLSTIKASAEEFISKETRLDVLTNNAGIMWPPKGTKSVQGYEAQMGTNCLGPFLFTLCLYPLLKSTAAQSPAGSVRVTWAGSSAIEGANEGGVQFESDGSPRVNDVPRKDYAQSKIGNVFLAAEASRRYGKDGIISVAWNPGNLKSELQRHAGSVARFVMTPLLYPPIFGAYTELYAGWSDDINLTNNGCYIIPWGRFGEMRPDFATSMKGTDEGGSGVSAQFWDWCVEVTRKYA